MSTDVYFAGPAIDGSLASLYGGDGTYGTLSALFTPTITAGPIAADWGLGSALNEPFLAPSEFPTGVTGVNYNGWRWFDGPSPTTNETMADPIGGSCGTGATGTTACASQRHHVVRERRPADRGHHGLPADVVQHVQP